MLICDGWTCDSVHYFAIFASYFDEITAELKMPLLALSPLLNEENGGDFLIFLIF